MRQTNSGSLETDTAAPTTSGTGESVRPGTNRSPPEPVCEVDPYPHYPAGIYEVRCIRTRVYRDPQFGNWKCLLVFQFLDGERKVAGFFNMGKGEKPRAGRRSRYFAAWVRANGDAPKKRQAMTWRVFVGKIFRVKIADITMRHDKSKHPDASIYSTVKEVLQRMWP